MAHLEHYVVDKDPGLPAHTAGVPKPVLPMSTAITMTYPGPDICKGLGSDEGDDVDEIFGPCCLMFNASYSASGVIGPSQ